MKQLLNSASNQIAGSSHVTFDDATEGSLELVLAMEYYNRRLSGWEPTIEPWRLDAFWVGNPLRNDSDLDIKITCESVSTYLSPSFCVAPRRSEFFCLILSSSDDDYVSFCE